MGFFLLKLSWMVFLLLSPSDPLAHAARDSLAAGQFLTVNQTLVSAGGTFTLGFFTPGRSTSQRYAGIWYSSTPEKAVVWVANRESPLTDPSGVLAVMADGSIAILEGGGRALWSSNVSGVPANAAALLLDTGNLVLRAGQADVWQSFDHPTDTLLPGMKLRVGRRSGNTGLVSWRDSQDPSPGEFSAGLDPDTYMQVKIWRGEETWLRSFLWSGNLVGAETKREGIITITLYEVNAEEMNLSISINQGSALLRVVLDPGGHVTRLFSRNRSEGWRVLDSHPSDPCDVYNRCGPSGICDSAGSSALCRCLEGFVPKNKGEWEKGEFTGGCVRTVPLGCGEGGEFLRLGRVRPPDRFRLIRNASAGQCETECSRSCNCTAYYFANVPSFRSSTRCLVWTGELVDVRSQDGPGPGFVNVKLASSQFVNHSQRGGSSGKKNILLVVTLSLLASGIFVLLLGILGVCVRKRAGRRGGLKNRCCLICSKAEKRRLRGMKSALGEFQSGESTSDLPVLDFRTVRDATNNFSTANKLGEGGFGPVYKGTLSEGEEIAVKRLSTQSGQGQEEFKNEISLIARLQHKNLVSLVGWCIKGEEKMLIYEFMPNKSLDLFLFDPTRAIKLDWGKRFHIIEGIAQGLLYLHKFSRLTIVHRDLKASNILLDADMNPKISDFGMARIFDSNETQANTRKVAGTIGYMAPEYAVHGLFSIKSDVFSFGVLLLEIVSGKRNVHTPHQSAFSLSLLEYAWELHNEGRELELVDPTLDASCPWQEISRCIHVALLCVQEVAADRPTTTELVAMLSSEGAALPAPKQPAFYTMEKINQESLSSVNDLTLSRIEGR